MLVHSSTPHHELYVTQSRACSPPKRCKTLPDLLLGEATQHLMLAVLCHRCDAIPLNNQGKAASILNHPEDARTFSATIWRPFSTLRHENSSPSVKMRWFVQFRWMSADAPARLTVGSSSPASCKISSAAAGNKLRPAASRTLAWRITRASELVAGTLCMHMRHSLLQ